MGTAAVQVNTEALCDTFCVCAWSGNDFLISFILYVFQFVIVGTFGETSKTDIAVDAVCVLACTGKKLTRGNSLSAPLGIPISCVNDRCFTKLVNPHL